MTIEDLWGFECIDCKHLFPDKSGCDAFPEGIPEELRTGERSHRFPYPGDRGIRYEPREPQPDETTEED